MKLTLIAILFFVMGCATSITGMLRFQDRELLIHPDRPGLAYPHKYTKCVDRKKPWRFFGKKCTNKSKLDFYDLNVEEVRKTLISGGFTCKSAMRFQY